MAGKKGQKHRFWSEDEKREICQHTTVPGVSVSQVARRYNVNANLVFKWLKDPRFAPLAEEDCVEDCVFLPIEIEGTTDVSTPAAALSATRVDITLSDGRRVLIEGNTDLSAVVTLVRGLAA